jgi:uncharacterized protein YkwD
LAAGALCALAAACTTPTLVPVALAPARSGEPYGRERAALVAAINEARVAAGVPALAYDGLLERVGDAHCAALVADDVWGHFARDGVPPYLRYLLAGGHGYHRENAASHSSSAPVAATDIDGIARDSLARMLAEEPPHDGHRRTLLDPTATHIGVGLAHRGGEVRISHEVAAQVAVAWQAAPPVARPHTAVSVAGELAPPWQVVAVEVLWEPLPHPLDVEEARGRGAYAYPARRSITFLDGPAWARSGLEVARRGAFRFSFSTGPAPGVEVAIVWGRRAPGVRELTALAASATVVAPDGTLPPALARWTTLAAQAPPD